MSQQKISGTGRVLQSQFVHSQYKCAFERAVYGYFL